MSRPPGRDRLEVQHDGRPVAVLHCQRARDVLVIEHTEVASGHRGHGHGGRLVAAVLDQARQERRGVVTVCPFARAWMAEHPGYAELDHARSATAPGAAPPQ